MSLLYQVTSYASRTHTCLCCLSCQFLWVIRTIFPLYLSVLKFVHGESVECNFEEVILSTELLYQAPRDYIEAKWPAMLFFTSPPNHTYENYNMVQYTSWRRKTNIYIYIQRKPQGLQRQMSTYNQVLFLEDPSSVPSTHLRQFTTSFSSSPRGSGTSFWPT